MKTQLSITQLAEQIERNQAAKRDLVVDTPALTMTAPSHDPDNRAMDFDLRIGGGMDESLHINDHAHGQIASRLDIPRKYYNRMMEDAPQLLVDNVNNWLHNQPERRMVRTMNNTVRAFLSDRYLRVENEQIAEVALPILAEIPDVQFVSSGITERRMYIKAVCPRIKADVSVGDTVQAGVIISNSEVGAGAVKVESFVYRLVCLNGMVSGTPLTQRHLGSQVGNSGDLATVLSDEAIAADDHALLLKVRDVIKAAVDESQFEKVVAKMRDSKEDRIEGDVPKAVEVLAKKTDLGKGEASGVLRHLIEGGDLSRYGLLNAVTRFSQDVGDYDRASELEALGGKVLDLSGSEWRQIATAA